MTKVLNAEEAAKTLRISLPTLYKLVKEGELAGRKVGKEYRISEENLQRFINGSHKPEKINN